MHYITFLIHYESGNNLFSVDEEDFLKLKN